MAKVTYFPTLLITKSCILPWTHSNTCISTIRLHHIQDYGIRAYHLYVHT